MEHWNPQGRLFVFTGKGGVGKTAFSLAYARALLNKGLKVSYTSFDQPAPIQLCQKFSIPVLDLGYQTSAETYIEKKLGSKMVASWIMKTPFFHSLFEMIPSLGSMILFGHLLEIIKTDPEHIVILDSPSSGHAITLFESTYNFKEIFRKGLIVDDINKMHDFLATPGLLQTGIILLPSQMALQEGIELQQTLAKLNVDAKLLLNDSFCALESIQKHKNELPEFLIQKVGLEEKVLEEYQDKIIHAFPRFATLEIEQSVQMLIPEMEKYLC